MLPTKLIIKILLCSFIILASGQVNGQEPLPRIVPLEEFLGPNQEIPVFDIETDPRGYLYMVTPGGVYHFNGLSLNNSRIKHKEGTEQSYNSIHKDYDGNLWFGGTYGIAYLDKDSLLMYPVPDSLLKFGNRSFESIYRDKKGLLHLAPRSRGHYVVDSTGQVTEIMTRNKTDINGFVVTQLDDGSWFHYSMQRAANKDSILSIYFLNDQNVLEKITDIEDKLAIYESSLVEHSDGSLTLSIGTSTLIRFSENQLIDKQVIDYKIIKLFVDSRNDLWIGTLKNGVLQAKDSDLSTFFQYDMNSSSAVVTETYDGGLWLKSSNIDFGYIPPNDFSHYSVQSGFEEINGIISVDRIDDKILLATENNELFLLKDNKLEPIPISIIGRRPSVTTTAYDEKNEVFWIGGNNVVTGVINGKVESLYLGEDFMDKKVAHLKNINGRIFGITRRDFFEIVDKKIIKILECPTGYFRDFIQKDDSYLFCTSLGVLRLKNGEFEEITCEKLDKLNQDFVSIFQAQENLWALTMNQELFKLSNDSLLEVFDQNNKPVLLLGHTVSDKGEIWGISNRGKLTQIKKSISLNMVNTEEFELSRYCVESVARHSVSVLNESIYIGSRYGLFTQKIENLTTKTAPSLLTFNVAINNEKVEYDTLYSLDYSENDIRIVFDAINFERSYITYSYMMEGYDTAWFETDFTQQHYTNLAPGVYHFKLRAKTAIGEWSQPTIITFDIGKPYWQTWWFRITITLLGLLIIYAIIKLRVKQVRNREEEKSKIALELARLEMRALKAQINPHFIFNSMTSAMYYLSKNENRKAESYLQRFAKLVRRILESSDQAVVRLVEEMELMRIYVQLESEQFEGEPIHFDISYNGLDPEKVKIPPTLIQPYIENAIQHGLKKKNGKRLIKLSFEVNQNELDIRIEDNGIGRVATQKENTFKEYKSYGMLISSRRIEVLNHHKHSKVRVDDLYDEQGNATGTCVIFKIPLPQDEIPLHIAN